MVKKIFFLPFVLLVIIGVSGVFLSCSTAPVTRREGRIEKLLERLNERDVEYALGMSRLPFVFDREIIMLQRDLETLWINLEAAGFTFKNYRIVEIEPVIEESYRGFSDTMEMQVYFDKYLGKNGSIVRINTDYGEFLLLLADRSWFLPEIFGLKGPL